MNTRVNFARNNIVFSVFTDHGEAMRNEERQSCYGVFWHRVHIDTFYINAVSHTPEEGRQ